MELLLPGSEVPVRQRSEDGEWLQVLLEDGAQGWVSTELLALSGQLSPVDGEAITVADEMRIVVAAAGASPDSTVAGDNILVFTIPIVDMPALHGTATQLVTMATLPTAAPSPRATATVDARSAPTASPRAPTSDSSRPPRENVDVFAFCDDTKFGLSAPAAIPPGSTIRIFWAWFANSAQYLQDHIDNAVHVLRVNGETIPDVNQYRGSPQSSGSQHVVYWYVPYGRLRAGEYNINYRVSWRAAISDGSARYGPGTATEFEEESCRFIVQ